MTVDTRRVQGRRQVHYETYDDLLADAERVATTPVRTLGNWSVGQTLAHLSAAMEGSIDGRAFSVPWWLRLLGKVYLRRRLVKGPFPPGFQLPGVARKRLVFDEVGTEAGLAMLRRAIERMKTEDRRIPGHPVAGPLSTQQWDSLHLRHAEMHMSFIVPETNE